MTDNGLFGNIYNPDVLTCLANLSNDEVFTPPDIANAVLDMLPQELFENPDTTFLDPACKSGVFLREIAKRLIKGLEWQIPDLQERLDHIFHKQLFGIAITELTSLLSRRSLYCSKYPNSEYSVSKFNNAQGNIRFKRIEHTWGKTVYDKEGKPKTNCIFCGGSKEQYERGVELETHAYEWIHMLNPKEIFNMKFDVIISNPPYQLSDGGAGASAKPLYHKFVKSALQLNPRYLTMIIPARWYAGGKGLDDFRKEMLNNREISVLVDYVNAKDCFPGTSIGGGVCYFLREKDYNGPCNYTNIHDGKKSSALRNLDEFSVFVRYNEALSIIRKVQIHNEPCFSVHVGSRNPYGLSSSTRGTKEFQEITLHSSAGVSYISYENIKQGKDSVDKYKIMISKVTAEHAGEPNKEGKLGVLSTTKVIKPNEVCTDSYLIAYTTDDAKKADNCASYMKTKFFRFLLLQAVSSINLSKEKFQFVPEQNYEIKWNDQSLYQKYELTTEEINFIETIIKPMD